MADINFHRIDCMDFMREIPDNYFDLAIVDPPYGIGDFRQSGSRKFHDKIKWNEQIPDARYFNELIRVSKNQIVWGVNYYAKYINATGRIIHDKTGGGFKNQLHEMSDADIASQSFGVNIKIFHFVWQGNAQGKHINWNNIGINKRIHPCQKPVELYRWTLNNYAKKGDKILDTHGGSMSLAIACEIEGFDLDVCENNEMHFNDGVARFNEFKAQKRMVFEQPKQVFQQQLFNL